MSDAQGGHHDEGGSMMADEASGAGARDGAWAAVEAYEAHHRAFHPDCNIDGPATPPGEQPSRAWGWYPKAHMAALKSVVEAARVAANFASSGWNDGTYAYCLICDSALCLTPGKLRGTRAPTFAEITHDPECPYPTVAAALGALDRRPTPPTTGAADGA